MEFEYEKEDFLTIAPYEELYKLHKEPFAHASALEALSAYALQKGFKGVKTMYKKYVASLVLYRHLLPSLPLTSL